ncbi:hypothetical protein MMP61_13790 [Acinetobacter sp. NIPH 1958]|uniref:hypothetical protein n=1 Tax=Acinetobacter sp. NIPH 1958 TaxID=2923430 RepID=UPI001F4B0B68|nr:hypothetical protein [Acinetobacter sp. NIPH 1958]MCH7356632.1 hypothetical protein [Acinetobacter sp. NIPH 1958]
MTKQASFRCEYCGTSYVYQQSLDMHLIVCSYRSKALAGQNVVKVYPKKEQLEHIVESLEATYDEFDYHRMSVSSDLRKTYDLSLQNLERQIHFIKSLYETKA